ncbi:hypothetical protein MKW98_006093 [Papaver atlanticum]|uniref:Carbohydrate kinase PfkB domain-containing protein n=1 Tax=Papaver atlanticum TaxID=357466 RepID=A0AAD4XX93_9MAGN|nr:hypothetical protein MKW98_006093 [Papaver atlanticum]
MLRSSSDVVCFDEMLMDFVPDVAGVSLAESAGFVNAPGGAPATKLGGSSAFIGKFGDDEFGHMLVDVLKKNEVNTEGFMFYRNPSADMLLKESELNMDLIKQAKIFHYGSISLITEPCRSAHMAAMKAAREAGALLSYDPNVRLPLWPSAEACRQGIMSIWNSADLIKVSDEEVEFLTQGDASDEKNVLSLWFDGLKLLLVTDGEKGCRYFTKNFKGAVKGNSVKTVDTTGAGDAFIGSFLHSAARDSSILVNECKLKNALEMANACGAICTTMKGAIPALPVHASAQNLILGADLGVQVTEKDKNI